MTQLKVLVHRLCHDRPDEVRLIHCRSCLRDLCCQRGTHHTLQQSRVIADHVDRRLALQDVRVGNHDDIASLRASSWHRCKRCIRCPNHQCLLNGQCNLRKLMMVASLARSTKIFNSTNAAGSFTPASCCNPRNSEGKVGSALPRHPV